MTRKIINVVDPESSSTKVGTDDFDYINKLLTGIDQSLTDPVHINTNVRFSHFFRLTGIVTPPQITTNQNNYAPTGIDSCNVLRLSTDASRNITGLVNAQDGRIIIMHNVGSFNIVFKDEDAGSTASNRFALNGDLTISPDQSCATWYDITTQRWRLWTTSGAAAGAGEANTTSNQGTGEGTLALAKSGVDLPFKTLKQGTNITITNNANDVTIAATGGGGAPIGASYVTLATDGTLTNERVLTQGTNISVVDGGAGTTVTLNVPDASTTVKGAVELATSGENAANVAVQGNDSRLSDSRNPLAHKDTHISGGGDTFVKGDVLVAEPQYLNPQTTDPTSDSRRVWIGGASGQGPLRFWDNQVTPVKHTIVDDQTSASGDLTGTYPSPTVTTDAISNTKLANMAANTVKVNATASAADPSDLSIGTNTVLGRKGSDIVAETIATAQIGDDQITFAKTQNIATDRLVGRDTTGAGDPEELTVGGGIEFTGSGGIQTSAFTGEVTKSAGGTATTIANDAVTYAKMQNVSATSRFIGRITAGAGDPEELTGTQATSLLDVAGASTTGVVNSGAQTFGGDKTFNGGIVAGSFLKLTNDETITLTGTQNNLAVAASSSNVRFNPATTLTITGIEVSGGNTDGMILLLHNVSSVDVILSDENVSSTAGNRFALNGNQTLLTDQSCAIYYDSTSSRWRLWASAIDTVSGGGGGAPTDAQYVTLAVDGTLTNERVITQGTNISFTDGGANGNLTIDVPNASTTVKGAVELATDGENASGLAVQANDGRLSDSRNPLAHKNSHKSGGGDPFAKDDVLVAESQYLNPQTTDPTSDSRRFWISGAGGAGPLKFWSNEVTPVKKSIIDDSTSATGDLTGTYPGPTVAADAVTNTKLANMAANTIKGNNTASSADPTDISVGTNTVLGRAGSNIVAQQVETAQIGDNQVTDAKIGSHTSTKITITAKGQLNSNIVYEDEDNNLGDHYLDVGDITTPANPGAGTRRIFVDSGTGKLSVRTSGGSTVSLEESGSGGAHKNTHVDNGSDAFVKGDNLEAAAQYLEDVADPTSDAQRVWIEDATSNLKFWSDEGSPVKRTVVTTDQTQTITGKTVNANDNTISNIGDSEIETHTTTKISTTSKSLLNSSIMYEDEDNDIGTHYLEFGEITAPSNPGTNKHRVYVDSADDHLKRKDSAGTVKDYDASAGGGAPTDAQYLTLATNGSLSAERVLTAGAGITLTDAGAGSTLTADFNFIDLVSKRVGFIDDFISEYSSYSSFLYGTTSGTGAQISPVENFTDSNVFGVKLFETGTTTTGYAVITNSNFFATSQTDAFLLLGQGVTTIEGRLKIPSNLSNSGNRYKIVFGFTGVPTTGTVNDGVYLEYLDSSSSNWRYCTSNDSTRTETNSSVAVAADTWYKLKIVINAAASSVEYFVDGSSLGSITTNIPSGTGDMLKIACGIYKSSGTSERTAYVDYIAFQIDLTTPR